MDDIAKKLREKRAREIAQEIDPAAGGFFRACMERAALLGMEHVDAANREKKEALK